MRPFLVMIEVDDSTWPIVRLTWVGAISLEDVEQLSADLKRVQSRSGPFVIVSDLTQLQASSATARIRQAVAQAADELVDRGALLAEAVVVAHPVLRALFTGYSWLRRTTGRPQETFPDTAAASAWALRQASQASLPSRRRS